MSHHRANERRAARGDRERHEAQHGVAATAAAELGGGGQAVGSIVGSDREARSASLDDRASRASPRKTANARAARAVAAAAKVKRPAAGIAHGVNRPAEPPFTARRAARRPEADPPVGATARERGGRGGPRRAVERRQGSQRPERAVMGAVNATKEGAAVRGEEEEGAIVAAEEGGGREGAAAEVHAAGVAAPLRLT